MKSCDMPLPAEPLEIRVTFSGNSDSEIALVLLLDVPGQLGGRKEVVLRGWGQQVTNRGMGRSRFCIPLPAGISLL